MVGKISIHPCEDATVPSRFLLLVVSGTTHSIKRILEQADYCVHSVVRHIHRVCQFCANTYTRPSRHSDVNKHLPQAAKLAEKRDLAYSTTIGWLRARLSFSLQPPRLSVMGIQGSRSTVGHARHDSMPDVAVVESQLRLDYANDS